MKKYRRTISVVTVCLVHVCLPPGGAAQSAFTEFTLEELMKIEIEPVFGASKRLQPVTEAPASVTIVTAEEIARYGYRTLADVLRSVRGFYVSNDRNYNYLGARGFARPGDFNSRILLLVDGHRMNDSVYEQAAIGRDFGVDASMFQRVEVIRGPSASLYGTSAFFAVVNVIMQNGSDVNGATMAADTGTFGSRSVRATVGRKLANGVDFSLGASHTGSDGPSRLYIPAFDAAETNFGVAEGLDDENSRQLFGRINIGGLTLTGAYGQRTKGVPTASYFAVFNDARLRTGDRRSFVDADYARTVRGTDVVVRGYFDRYDYNGSYPYEADGPEYRDYARGMWAGTEARVTRSLAWRQKVSAGGEFRDNFRQGQGGSTAGAPEDDFAVNRSAKVGAVFVQDEIMIHQRLHASLGVRYDMYAGFSRATPRAALILTPSRRQAIKYLFGTAFRAPNAYELDYFSDGQRNEGLRPETIRSHEVVWERYTGTWLRTSVSAYRNDVSELLTLENDPAEVDGFIWTNHGDARAAGLELEGEWRFGRIEGLASYTYQRARDVATREELTNSPRQATKVRFSTPGPTKGATIALETQYLGSRRTLAGNAVDSFVTANLMFVEPVGHGLDVVAGIRNIFGAHYADPGSEEHRQDVIEQDGRVFTVGLRWRLRNK
jgi:iron complex outermembrane receptor protein